MLPYKKKERRSVDSMKRTCTLEKKKMLSSHLRERLAFQSPDIFYRTLQRVCLTILTFHGFHLLRQKGANSLYPSKVSSVSIDLVQGWKNNDQLKHREEGIYTKTFRL